MNSPLEARMNGPVSTADPPSDGVAFVDRVRALRMPGRADVAGKGGGGSWVPWVLCGLLAACSLSLAVRYYGRPPAPREDAGTATGTEVTGAPAGEPGAAPRPVMPSKKGGPAGALVHEAWGYIIPVRQTPVSPIEVSGRIIDLRIREGMRVKEGDILAVIDSTRYKADADEARAVLEQSEARFWELANGTRVEEVESAEAELAEARATLKQLKQEFIRSQGIKSGALAAKEYELAESGFRAGEHRVRKLERTYEMLVRGPRAERIAAAWAEVKQNRARLERAEWLLGNCTIRAPMSGTVLTKPAEVGGFLNSLANNSAFASGLCDLADLTDLEVDLTISEREVARIAVGMPCRVRSETYDREYTGRVEREMPNADQAKAGIFVRVKITDDLSREQGKYLKPKTRVVVTFVRPSEKDAAAGQ